MKSLITLFLFVSVFFNVSAQQKENSFIAFTDAALIDGSGAAPVQNAVLLIQDGRIISAGAKEQVTIPEGAVIKDISGKFIIPGLINTHGHVGDVKGIEAGHYSAQNIIDNLFTYARYGITTVISLGGDHIEAEALRTVNDPETKQHARLYIAGDIITGKTPEEALRMVEGNNNMGVDFMKIRVDDNLGTIPKMTETVYRAVINRAHALNYKVATHMYYLDDAKKLLNAGSDMMAHSVRDKIVDEAFIKLIKQKNACYCPTLTRELSTFVYEDTAAFFTDTFFTREYDSQTIQPLKDPANILKVKSSASAKTYKQQLPVAMANLKTLSDSGVIIVMGTDSGMPGRFMGYFEHLEMEMMAKAGMTPAEIIASATKDAASCMGLKETGSLIPGYHADFIILNDNPLTDIRNTRKIQSVFISGQEVSR